MCLLDVDRSQDEECPEDLEAIRACKTTGLSNAPTAEESVRKCSQGKPVQVRASCQAVTGPAVLPVRCDSVRSPGAASRRGNERGEEQPGELSHAPLRCPMCPVICRVVGLCGGIHGLQSGDRLYRR
jgi:hypothetical protein